MSTQSEKADRFVALHECDDVFVIPNPWDAASARVLGSLGVQYVLLGAVTSIVDQLRMDIRAVDVETSEIVTVLKKSDRTSELLTVVVTLADDFTAELDLVPPSQRPELEAIPVSATIEFSRAVDFEDRGEIEQAIAHIADYGSGHTESIVTADAAAAQRFFEAVDSAIVLQNASTQFADGGEFGMGAEIGIATGRIHARGPVGADQLTSYKYVVRGTGQTRP